MNRNIAILRGGDRASELRDSLSSAQGDIAAWMEDNTRLLKNDSSSVVGLLPMEQGLACLKLYRYQSALRRGLLSLGCGRPLRSFDMGCALVAQGLPVARPLACLRVREGALLLGEGIADARDLQSSWRSAPDGAHAREMLLGAAAVLARLHQSAYAHGDCKWSNLLFSADQCWLVDLDAAKKAAPGSGRQMRDLARFILNAEEEGVDSADFELFMECYLGGSGLSREQVLGRIMPPLRKLRARHLARYGPRGAPLL